MGVNLRRLAIRGMRLLTLLCMVIVCSAAGQDTITGDPPPCAASDATIAEHDSGDPSADDSLDTEEAEAPPAHLARLRTPQLFFSPGQLTRPVSLQDIPPKLAL